MNKENAISTDQKIKTLKLVKFKNAKAYYPCYDQELILDPNYEFDQETFLCELFRSIDDFGAFIDGYLADKSIYFSGNGHWGELTENNRMIFGDHYNENDLAYEMDFNDFLSVNYEYHKLCHSEADEIILTRIGEKVSLEAKWLEKDNLDALKNINQ